MATVSNNYNDAAAIYNDWVSEASESQEENEFFCESDEETSSHQIDSTPNSSDIEDFVEFDGTSSDTEFFFSAGDMHDFTWEEENNEDLSYYYDLSAIDAFDFSSVHVPVSKRDSNLKSSSASEGIEDYSLPNPQQQDEPPSLLSPVNEPDTNQVMNDSIHVAEDTSSFFDVSGNELLSQDFAQINPLNSLALNQDIPFGFYENTYEEEEEEEEGLNQNFNDSMENEEHISSHQDEFNNSPSKQQTALKKVKELKDAQEEHQEQDLIRPLKRKRTISSQHNESPDQDTITIVPNCSNESKPLNHQKRRRLNSDSQNTNSNLPLQNLVRKKYLIALNDPRFMPQFNDPTLKSQFFANEQVLRIINTDYDVDII